MLLGPHAQAAVLASAKEGYSEAEDSLSAETPDDGDEVDGIGLGLTPPARVVDESDEDRTMTVPLDVSPQKLPPPVPAPEPGYRFPGPAPSHSLEHAALRGSATGSPASSISCACRRASRTLTDGSAQQERLATRSPRPRGLPSATQELTLGIPVEHRRQSPCARRSPGPRIVEDDVTQPAQSQ
jgi:hypothetical protein